jgi:hypothetical protein
MRRIVAMKLTAAPLPSFLEPIRNRLVACFSPPKRRRNKQHGRVRHLSQSASAEESFHLKAEQVVGGSKTRLSKEGNETGEVDTSLRDRSIFLSARGVLGTQEDAIAYLASSTFGTREGKQAFLADYGSCLRDDDDAQRILAAAEAHAGDSEAARAAAPLRPYQLSGATLAELDARAMEEQSKSDAKYQVSVVNPLAGILLPVQVGPLDENPHRVHPTDHAAFLLPVQEALHDYACEPLRRLTALLSWEDPYATTLLYLKVCTITLVLAIVPWAPLMRLIGFAILGPHMALVGHKYYKAAQADQAAERAFEAMSEDERKEKLDTHRQTLLAQHVDALLAEAANQGSHSARPLVCTEHRMH